VQKYIYYNKALGNIEIIDSLVEIGEFLLNMCVIFLSSQLQTPTQTPKGNEKKAM
jgi:hypothetical protein